ncbi:hypothetical protein [Lentibacillus jeotgali]|uniref:hypothetical protein n=1 Tax=Lentibacillus jeotgali TaxID=558169 RepID=UPI00026278B6|nr:hypothetical protein [Lentibacillus jeotgali]
MTGKADSQFESAFPFCINHEINAILPEDHIKTPEIHNVFPEIHKLRLKTDNSTMKEARWQLKRHHLKRDIKSALHKCAFYNI